MSTTTLPDLNRLDREAKALVTLTHERLLSRESEIEHLKLLIAKLRRMQFGRRSEKVQQQIEQLELRLEDLDAKRAAGQAKSESASASNLLIASRAARRPLPEHLPRQTHKHEPAESVCPDCGGQLRRLGEDISEMLEYVPARFQVIRYSLIGSAKLNGLDPRHICAKCSPAFLTTPSTASATCFPRTSPHLLKCPHNFSWALIPHLSMCPLRMVTKNPRAGKLQNRLEPTIGLAPMTCRLRVDGARARPPRLHAPAVGVEQAEVACSDRLSPLGGGRG